MKKDTVTLRWGIGIGLVAAAARSVDLLFIARGMSVCSDATATALQTIDADTWIAGLVIVILGSLSLGWRLGLDALRGVQDVTSPLGSGIRYGVVVASIITLFDFAVAMILMVIDASGCPQYGLYALVVRFPPGTSFPGRFLYAVPFTVFQWLFVTIAAAIIGMAGIITGTGIARLVQWAARHGWLQSERSG